MPGDDIEMWFSLWGGSLVNRRLTKAAVLLTHELVMKLDEWGVKWVKENGQIARRPSGASGTDADVDCLMAEGATQFMLRSAGKC